MVCIIACILAFAGCGLKEGIQQNPGLNLVGNYNTPGHAYDIFVQGDYAYVADGDRGLLILNISNPFYPDFEASYATPGPATKIFVSSDYFAYVIYSISANQAVHVFDVANPANPVLASNLDSVVADYLDIYPSGQYAYAAAGNSGFKVFDVRDPVRPSQAGIINGFFPEGKIFVQGNYAFMTYYIAAGGKAKYVTIDVASPANPTQSSPVDLLNEPVNALYVYSNFAFACFADSGLRVLNVATPASPDIVAGYDTYGQCEDIFVDGSGAYIADGLNGVVMLNVANPTQPYLVGYYGTPGPASGIFASNGYIFVAVGEAGIEVLEFIR